MFVLFNKLQVQLKLSYNFHKKIWNQTKKADAIVKNHNVWKCIVSAFDQGDNAKTVSALDVKTTSIRSNQDWKL